MGNPVLVLQTYNPVTTGANSYALVSDFKTYHDNRIQDYTAWADPLNGDPKITAALIAATDYIDRRFSYIGWRTVKEQTTEFPRNSLWNTRGDLITGIPVHVMWACCAYAIRWLRNGYTLVADPYRDETGMNLKKHEVEAGPVKEIKEYGAFSVFEWPIYPEADSLLKSQGFVSNPRVNGIISSPTGRG